MHQGRIYIRAPYVLGTQPLRFTDPVIREQKDYFMLEAALLLEFTFNFLHPLPSLLSLRVDHVSSHWFENFSYPYPP